MRGRGSDRRSQTSLKKRALKLNRPLFGREEEREGNKGPTKELLLDLVEKENCLESGLGSDEEEEVERD